MKKVFIDGSVGTTGLRIAERLACREDIKLIELDEDSRKNADARKTAINSSDYTFLCLPDEAARQAVSFVENDKTVIIDASTAHRISNGWAYGLPELSEQHKNNIKNSRRIAVPGCFASGFSAIVYPLVKANIINADCRIAVNAVSGYSGAGKQAISFYENQHDRLLDSPGHYALSASHKHLSEMQYVCSLSQKPLFNPMICNYYSGMIVAIPFYINEMSVENPNQLRDFFKEYYQNQRLIKITEYADDSKIYGSAMAGFDNMEIIINGNDERVNIYAVFCNLGKGASGAAVQCFNISAGADETAGLNIK